ncbi:hypothetical protein [Streptomyces sp. NPDC048295]|uniref:effector-associated constant component EACC1 n=1 Tax=Streptomyces sp. NPDC048295 TaxID=3154617 RepID=UPI003442C24B
MSAGELRSLHGWLRSDPEVRRSATVGVRGSELRPGETGAAMDVPELVTRNGWSAASFVPVLVAWRKSRPQQTRLEIHRGDTVYTVHILTGGSDEEVEPVVRALDADGDEDASRWACCPTRGVEGGAGGDEPLPASSAVTAKVHRVRAVRVSSELGWPGRWCSRLSCPRLCEDC